MRPLCALAAVLAVALWPAAAHARVSAGGAGTEQPRLWGVEIGTHAGTFARPAHLARMKHAGINAVVLDPRRLTLKELRATVKAAKAARLWVIELIPPAHAKATKSVKAVRATCRAPSKPGQTLCAASASLSAAIALSRSGSAEPMVAVRLAGPAQVGRLRGGTPSGLQILALVKLRPHRYASSEWRKAIAVAATTSSLNLAVTPTGANQTLSPYLNQLGKPPSAPGLFAVTDSTASTLSLAWAAVVGATEYDVTANGRFAGKTATTSFTVGGLACSTAYKLVVTAKNAAGKNSKASTLTRSTAPCSDATPPSPPAGLTETSATQTSATVAWASSADNVAVAGYGVFVDGASVGTTAATTYSVSGLTCGSTHTVAVDAFDSAGNHSARASMSASTSVCSDSTPPTVSVTAPAGGATVSGTVPVTASASDNVAVSSVEFWVDGAKKAADTSAPYSYSWDTTQVLGGPHTILVKAVDTSNNSASTNAGVTVSNSPCVTSSASWQNTAMLSPDGTFDVSFDATPSAGNVDALTGLSAAPALAYTDLAVIARFNTSGSIDAINGGGYAAANTVPYAGGSTYHFRAAVNVPSHTYSLYVTPPGKPETPVALNYAFRTGQGAVTALSNWAVTAASGSHETCGLALTNPNDMTAPSAPTALVKSNSTQTSLTASWTASTDSVGVGGYTVYVNSAASSAAAGTSRTISSLACGTTYTIGVDAYDSAGNHSAQTSTTMATSACPGDTTPPSTPTNLNQSGSTATSVTVSWTASTDNVGVTGYTLYLNGAQVGTTTDTSTTATGLSCGTTYTVGVDAFDAAGNHTAKASISVSTAPCSGDTTPPSTPKGLATSAVGQTSITLSWTASSDNVAVTGYRLYLGGSQVGTSLSTSYLFSGLACGTSHTLGVAAVDGAGNVSGTAMISGATAACSASSQFAGTFDCYGSTPNCSGSGATCTSTISSGLQTALNSAVGGNVICLNTANYGAVSVSSKSYSSDVIVQPAAGASATLGKITVASVNHLRFSGIGGTMNVAGTTLSGTSGNDTFDHLVYTACVQISPASSSNILFDHDRLDNLGGNGAPGCPDEGRIQVLGGSGSTKRLTISNSHFGGQGPSGTCSDGIQLEGDGVQVGPGNEFTNMPQSVCSSTHSDPIQIVGASNEVITGNWFHDNGDGSGGCMCHDFNPDNVTITNNVFASTGYAYSILSGEGADNWLISDNVFFKTVKMNYNSPNGTGDVMRDNVWVSGAGGAIDSGSGVSYDHNLNSGKAGTGNISGTQVFVSSPLSGYYHYLLDPSSPGYHAASDGKSMGISP